MKKYIPNFLSILNLISGVVGILLIMNNYILYAAYIIFLGIFFDFLDGFIARLFCTQSLLGKELDSLADIITFGILPSMIIYQLIQTYQNFSCPYLSYISLLIVIFSSIRLAKFNIDTKQQIDKFIGLPTPVSAIIVATIPMIINRSIYPKLVYVLMQPLILSLLSILLAYFLVSKIHFLNFTKKNFFQINVYLYILIIIVMLLITIIHVEVIFIIFWLYIFYCFLRTKLQ